MVNNNVILTPANTQRHIRMIIIIMSGRLNLHLLSVAKIACLISDKQYFKMYNIIQLPNVL